MQTTRIVLTEPFVKHPAGLVFELPAAMNVGGWDVDERVRDRQNFSGKQTYRLPDGGNGNDYELPIQSTRNCPAGIFEDEALHKGPFRLTRAALDREGAGNEIYNPGFNLLEINGIPAQGFEFPMDLASATSIVLRERLEGKSIRSLELQPSFDGCDLMPGFYEIRIGFQSGDPYYIRFIKSFPSLVIFDGSNGTYHLQKTLY